MLAYSAISLQLLQENAAFHRSEEEQSIEVEVLEYRPFACSLLGRCCSTRRAAFEVKHLFGGQRMTRSQVSSRMETCPNLLDLSYAPEKQSTARDSPSRARVQAVVALQGCHPSSLARVAVSCTCRRCVLTACCCCLSGTAMTCGEVSKPPLCLDESLSKCARERERERDLVCTCK